VIRSPLSPDEELSRNEGRFFLVERGFLAPLVQVTEPWGMEEGPDVGLTEDEGQGPGSETSKYSYSGKSLIGLGVIRCTGV